MKYWYIKIARNDVDFDIILNKCLNDKSIGIGFNIMTDYNFTTMQYRSRIWKNYGNNNKQIKIKENIFNKFINQMKNGDIVFLCKGKNKIKYIAEISSNYYYDKNYCYLPHRRHIDNIKLFETNSPKQMIGTLYEV